MSSKPKMAAAPGPLTPTHISVTFKIITPDSLRRIIFTLSRMSDSQTDSWMVMFEFDERTDPSQDFQMVVQLIVDIDHNDATAAAATAKHGMDSDQHAQALVAGDTAKDVGTGEATMIDAQADAAGIVSARNPNSPV